MAVCGDDRVDHELAGDRADELVGRVRGDAGAALDGRTVLLLASPDGPDATLDTLDDSFALAPDAPAIDAGLDARVLLPSIEARLFTADYAAEGARPQDGDGDGESAFDIGAIERDGPRGPSAFTNAAASREPDCWDGARRRPLPVE